VLYGDDRRDDRGDRRTDRRRDDRDRGTSATAATTGGPRIAAAGGERGGADCVDRDRDGRCDSRASAGRAGRAPPPARRRA
jgi:hypothetical protein